MSVGLHLENITYTVDNKNLVSGVDIICNEGEIVCVIGKNGAGKSTLLKLATGILAPKSGRILAAEKDLNSLSIEERARLLTYLPQHLRRADFFSVFDFLNLRNEARTPDIARKILSTFGVETLLERSLSSLSGGEWARVQLARAWAEPAKVRLLDEPTASLDLTHMAVLAQECLRASRNQKISFLIASHDLGFVFSIADKICAIESGKILKLAPPEEFSRDSFLSDFYGTTFLWQQNPHTQRKIPIPAMTLAY